MESIKRKFISISILPSPDGTARWIKFRNILFGALMFISLSAVTMSSLIFLYKFKRIDFESALYSIQQITGFGNPLYALVAGYRHRQRIQKLFKEFEIIRRKYPSEFIEKADQRGETLSKFLLEYFIIGWCTFSLATAMMGYIFKWIESGRVDIDDLYSSFKFIWPWDQQTIFGWIIDTIIATVSGGAFLLMNGLFLSLFITICQYQCSFCEHYNTLLPLVSNETFMNSLQNSIRYHIRIKRLFYQTTDLFSNFILIQLISNTIFLSDVIFQMDLAFKRMDLIFVLMIWAVFVSASILFFYCYFGQTTTDCYLKIADHAYELNWYNQSKNVQKYFLAIIQNAQQPIYYHGFGMAYLTLDAYCKIIRTVFSYYMMFKALMAKL